MGLHGLSRQAIFIRGASMTADFVGPSRVCCRALDEIFSKYGPVKKIW
jgi:hypothetical protein